MESQKTNSNLKAVILVLSLLLAGSLAYTFKLTNDANTTYALLTTAKSEKDKVLENLTALKAKYDEAITSNTTLTDEITVERDKVVALMTDIKRSKGDVAAMAKYKKMYYALESKMNTLIAENETLKKDNLVLATQRDSTITVLSEARKVNDGLAVVNQDLTKTVAKAEKLKVLNLKTVAYKVRSSGKQIETEKARRADMLKVNFTIAENEVAKSGDKTYNVQIIDSKNNVLGEKKVETFGEKNLTYSFATTVKYENKTVDVTQDIPGENFEKGEYFVNIFDKDELVSKTSFVLK
jgi:type IV secretory pathway VirJ component